MQFFVPPHVRDPKERAAIMDRQRRAQETTAELRTWTRRLGIEGPSSVEVQRLRICIGSGVGRLPSHAVALPAAIVAAGDLCIPVPRVETTTKAEAIKVRGPGVVGWADLDENEIFIRQGRCLCETALTAAHEVRHRATIFGCEFGDTEKEAQEYERHFARKFLEGVRCSQCRRLVTEAIPRRPAPQPTAVHFVEPQVTIERQLEVISKLGAVPIPAFHGPRLPISALLSR